MSSSPPILSQKHYEAPSAFTAHNLLREARRQKSLAGASVPAVCVLDPDGDIVRRLKADGRARLDFGWACYHTELHRFDDRGIELGIIGCAVGAPFAVLVAEELFASGCQFLISVTSAGRLTAPGPCFVLIDRALRDEGTSYHYLPAAEFSHADARLLDLMSKAFARLRVPVERGATWTTDAPFRETAEAIAARRSTRSRRRAANRFCASRTSPIRWRGSRATSRKARPTAPRMRWPSCARRRQRGLRRDFDGPRRIQATRAAAAAGPRGDNLAARYLVSNLDHSS